MGALIVYLDYCSLVVSAIQPFFVDKCLIPMGDKEFHCFFTIYALLAYSLCLCRFNCTTRMLINRETCSVPMSILH